MVFGIACSGDDEGQKVAPQVGADGGPGAFSLRGEWVTSDFACRNAKRRETVSIGVFDTMLTATKVDGDDCVPAGYVAFEGKLPKAMLSEAELPVTFSFKLYDGAAGDPASIAVVESGMGKVLTPDSFTLALKTAQLRFTRVATGANGGADAPATAGRRASARAGAGGTGGSQGDEEGDNRAGSGGKGGSGGSRATATRSIAGRGGSGGAGASARTQAGSGGDGEEAGAGGAAGAGGEGGGGARAGAGAAAGSGGSAAARDCKGPILPGAKCDHVAQCGCDDGENCRFDGTEPPSCFPAGPTKQGEVCEEDSECAAGLVCVAGLCAQMCRSDGDCNDGRCVGVMIGDEDVEGYLACLEKCDPVLQPVCFGSTRPTTPVCNACGTGATCLPTAQFAGCFLGAFTRLRDPGEPCTADEECYGGGCLEGTCREWCRYDTDCADSSSMCRTGLGYFAGGGDEIGLCSPGFSQDDS
jgi:hypothetical protein